MARRASLGGTQPVEQQKEPAVSRCSVCRASLFEASFRRIILAIPLPEPLLSRRMEENPKVSAPGADRCLYGNPNDC